MYYQKKDQYQNESYQTQRCKYGEDCIHLQNTGTCSFYHPPNEIPCYHGSKCKYYKSGQCQFKHPQDSNNQKKQQQRKQYFNDNNYYEDDYDQFYENDNQNDYDYEYYYNNSQKQKQMSDQQQKRNMQREEYIEDDYPHQNQNLDSYLERDFQKYLKISDNKQNYREKPEYKVLKTNPDKVSEQKQDGKKEEKKEDKNQEKKKPKKKKHDPDDDIIDFRNQTITYPENNFKKGDLPLYADFFQVVNQKRKKKV